MKVFAVSIGHQRSVVTANDEQQARESFGLSNYDIVVEETIEPQEVALAKSYPGLVLASIII